MFKKTLGILGLGVLGVGLYYGLALSTPSSGQTTLSVVTGSFEGV